MKKFIIQLAICLSVIPASLFVAAQASKTSPNETLTQTPNTQPGNRTNDGMQGVPGSSPLGYTGHTGERGGTGPRAYTGVTGDSGYTGTRGATGTRGTSGPTGTTGPTGTKRNTSSKN